MDEKSPKIPQAKISFESASCMVQDVMWMWMVEEKFVELNEMKTTMEWAEEFNERLTKAAELGPKGYATYMVDLIEKIAPRTEILEVCKTIVGKSLEGVN